ncbi:MAG: hypothetical protein QOF95_3199 [Pseudonocardiales bacterium]|nr:hypothetical protein [Pseudonocardiales bacterium]
MHDAGDNEPMPARDGGGPARCSVGTVDVLTYYLASRGTSEQAVQGISTRLSPISSERIGQLAMGAAALIEWMRQRYNCRGGVGNEDCPAAAEA